MAEQTSSSHPLFEYQRSILTMEIEYIHSQIAHFDTLSFQIKGWTVTIWAAIIAFGSTQQVIVVVLSSIPAVLTFWVLDAFFKTYQGRLMSRMGAIEAFLDSDWCFKEKGLREAFQSQDFGQFPIHDPICRRTRELNAELKKSYEKSTRFRGAFFVRNIAYFYLLLLLSTVIIGLSLLL